MRDIGRFGQACVVVQRVRELLEEQRTLILLNLADVDYIDSSGIGELVSAYTGVKNRGGSLKLLQLTKKVHDLLQPTKLFTFFKAYSDHHTALRPSPHSQPIAPFALLP